MNKILLLFKLIKTGLRILFTKPKMITVPNIKEAVIGSNREVELIKLLNKKHGNLELHKEEQFYYRVSIMNPKCIENKQCPCTCEIFGNQLTNDPCDDNCYPFMMDLETWKIYKEINQLDIEKIKETVLPILLKFYKI